MFNKLKKFKNSGTYSRRLRRNCGVIHRLNVAAALRKTIVDQIVTQPIAEFSSSLIEESVIVADINGSALNFGDVACSNTSSDEEDETLLVEKSMTSNMEVQIELRKWAVLHNITQMVLKDLLKIFNTTLNLTLPQDPRTIMKTPTSITISTFEGGGGQYWHHGLEVCLLKYFDGIEHPIDIAININIDGLPIHKSSKVEFWPILFNIHGMPSFKPMIIGIFCGEGKPKSANDFMMCFVDELKVILAVGVQVNGFKISFKIRSFICDSPARAFIKGTNFIST